MKKVIILFLILFLELCCSLCHFKNLHIGHKLYELEDEESLKKENITIESCSKELNELVQKVINLKNKIEEEINKIDNSYVEVNNEIIKLFKIKHEKLIKEENELKEQLQNEVTKIKDKLEMFLSESNNLIRINEKIAKGIKIFEKEDNKNMLKTLSYVSKINKNKKGMKSLFQQLMKNLKISFLKDETKVKYEEYFFNGIVIPKDIEFNNVWSNSFRLVWKIDNLNILNIDNKLIKYRVEIKKENGIEKFLNAYEGNDSCCTIENLEKNNSYEIRICCIYKDIIGSWTDITKIKTLSHESIILSKTERSEEFLQKIYEWIGCKGIKLIYRLSKDGAKSIDFHKKCDNQGETLVLYENEKGNIFGGFTSISWTSDGSYHNDPNSFIFTLTNIHDTKPTEFPLRKDNNKYAVDHRLNFGPKFGNDIKINNNFLEESNSDFPWNYEDTLQKGKSIFTGNTNNKINSFKLKEIEVFTLIK